MLFPIGSMSLRLFDRDQIDVTFEETTASSTRLRKWLDGVLDDVTHMRIYNVSVIHWALLVVWLSLLLSFATVYGRLYSASALVATLCANVLLFGVSDIMAQTIQSFLSHRIDPLSRAFDTPFFISGLGDELGFTRSGDEDEEVQSDHDYTDGDEDDNLSVFNDYGSPMSNRAIANINSSADLYDAPDAPESHIFAFYRWICFIFWGFIISFFQVPWYKFLNFFYTEDPSIIQVLERVLSDQLLYSPISLYCFFMYSNYVTESGDAATFDKKIQRLFISTLGCNYLVWPMVQMINFSIVPKHLQVPFSSSVGILWNCFLSMRNASEPS